MSPSPSRTWVVLLLALAVFLALSGCAGVNGSGSGDQIGFENATESSGLHYTDTVGAGIGNGNAGIYALNYDRDGWTDLLTVGGEHPALFQNANGTYERTGAVPSLETDAPVKSATVVDYDNDGWADIVLFTVRGPAVALHNDRGTFEHADIGLGNFTYPLGAAVGDYNGDGRADLLVYQSGSWARGKPAGYFSLNATIEEDNGNPNVLYENVNGEFRRVNATGITGDRWSLAASFVDLNGDGDQDIHVANDYNTDMLYVNHGNETFASRQLKGSTERNGMASEVADVTGDGNLDVFVSNIHLPISPGTVGSERYDRLKRYLSFVIHSGRTKGNTLLVNQGNGTFVDRADELGIRHGGWAWAASFVDLDDDGRRDLVTTTQTVVRINQTDPTYTYPMLWQRGESAFKRLDASERGFDEHNGRGMVSVDYDRDGDRDLVMANYGGPYTVYENVGTDTNHALDVRVVDANGSTALGATVTIRHDSETTLRQHSRTDYLSQEPRVRHVGLGDATAIDLTVTWPDGTTRTFEDVAVDQRLRVTPNGLDVVATFGATS